MVCRRGPCSSATSKVYTLQSPRIRTQGPGLPTPSGGKLYQRWSSAARIFLPFYLPLSSQSVFLNKTPEAVDSLSRLQSLSTNSSLSVTDVQGYGRKILEHLLLCPTNILYIGLCRLHLLPLFDPRSRVHRKQWINVLLYMKLNGSCFNLTIFNSFNKTFSVFWKSKSYAIKVSGVHLSQRVDFENMITRFLICLRYQNHRQPNNQVS